MKKVIEASMAVALAVKLCKPAVIPMYPITPQTHVVERLADFIDDGELDSEMIHAESEHSALSACVGAQATGVRTFTATSSQGLALMFEVLFAASGLRLPIVMVNVNRALSAPINIWNDQQDSVSARDSGWIQLYVESSQEALDTVIQAYKIAEKVLLPVMVCVDGYSLSHVHEPVDVPKQNKVDKFLPKYKPKYFLDPKKPLTMGPIAPPETYMEIKKMQQDAMTKAVSVIKNINNEFKKGFKRGYGNGLIETYKMDNAQYAVMAMGSVCGTIRTVIDEMRKKGTKVGMVKLKSFRPFPEQEIINATKNLKGLAVIDRNISLGNKGALFTEVKSIIKNKKIIINGFIAGLGGRDVTQKHIKKVISQTMKSKKTKEGWLF